MAATHRFTVTSVSGSSDVEIDLPSGADMSALAEALGSTVQDMIVQGKIHSPWTTLDEAGVVDGSAIAIGAAAPSATPSRQMAAVLDQLAGVEGLGSIELAVGRSIVDSVAVDASPTGSLTVHPGHSPAVIDNSRITRPTPLGLNVLNVGRARYHLHASYRAADVDEPSPRTAPSTVRRVTPPTLPQLGRGPRPLLWAVPLVIAVVLGGLGFLTPIAFVGAALALATSLGVLLFQRKARRAQIQRHRTDTSRLIEDFESTVERRRHVVEAELRAANPSVPEIARVARRAGPPVDTRSVGDHDFGQVALGYGDLDWAVEVNSAFELPPPLQRVVAANNRLTSVPMVVDVARGPIGLAGRRDDCLSVARALVLSVAATSSPTELRVDLAVDADQLAEWDWLKWLPHVDHRHGVATSIEAADHMVSSSESDRLQIVLIDGLAWTADQAATRALIVLAADRSELAKCSTVLEVKSDGTATLTTSGSEPIPFVTPVGAAPALASDIARGLAGLFPSRTVDPEEVRQGIRPFALEPEPTALTPPPIPLSARRPSAPAGPEAPRRTLIVPPAIPAEYLTTIDLRPESLGPDIDLGDDNDHRWNRRARY